MRILARRLLPVIAFALVLCLVLTGLFRHSRSQLTLGGHRRPINRRGPTGGTGVSGSVGSMPGIAHGVADPWPYAASQATHGTLTVAAKPLPTAQQDGAEAKQVKLLPADVLVVDPSSLSGRCRHAASASSPAWRPPFRSTRAGSRSTACS